MILIRLCSHFVGYFTVVFKMKLVGKNVDKDGEG